MEVKLFERKSDEAARVFEHDALEIWFRNLQTDYGTCQNVGDKYCYLEHLMRNGFWFTKMHENAYGMWKSCTDLISNSHLFCVVKSSGKVDIKFIHDTNNSTWLSLQMICKNQSCEECVQFKYLSWFRVILCSLISLVIQSISHTFKQCIYTL